jgi:hypothetical protein
VSCRGERSPVLQVPSHVRQDAVLEKMPMTSKSPRRSACVQQSTLPGMETCHRRAASPGTVRRRRIGILCRRAAAMVQAGSRRIWKGACARRRRRARMTPWTTPWWVSACPGCACATDARSAAGARYARSPASPRRRAGDRRWLPQRSFGRLLLRRPTGGPPRVRSARG